MTRTELYRQATGDRTTHHRTIDKHFKQLGPRTRKMIDKRAAGASIAELARQYGISRASATQAIARGLAAIELAIQGKPRYWKVGRGKPAAQDAAQPRT